MRYYILYTLERPKQKILITSSVEDEKQPEFSHIAGANAKWYNQCGKWFGHFLQS